MLKKFVFSCWCIFLMCSHASIASLGIDQKDKINQRSVDGKKQGRWIIYGEDRPSEGFPAKGKIEEGNYKDDRREGVWIMYHNDGVTPKLRGEYSNNRPNGKYVKYHMNGKIKEIGNSKLVEDVLFEVLNCKIRISPELGEKNQVNLKISPKIETKPVEKPTPEMNSLLEAFGGEVVG